MCIRDSERTAQWLEGAVAGHRTQPPGNDRWEITTGTRPSGRIVGANLGPTGVDLSLIHI
eukprot:15021964-Alexandrium_andersonii.AAC.1